MHCTGATPCLLPAGSACKWARCTHNWQHRATQVHSPTPRTRCCAHLTTPPAAACCLQVGQVHASMAATAVSMWAETGSVAHGHVAPAAASVAGSDEYATSVAGPASMEAGGEGGWDVRSELISEAAAASLKVGTGSGTSLAT